MMMASTLKPAPLSRSRSSDSSASSLSSTFSDIITSSTSDSSITSKTHAFFATPFSTQPPSPAQYSSLQLEPKPAPTRSLTTDFFSTPVRPASPPTSTTVKEQRTIHPSRIFPSRYTSTVDRSPDFVSLDIQSLSPTNVTFLEHSPSSGSESSFTSSFVETRLPTPPPRLPITADHDPSSSSSLEPSSSQPTPRPPNLEPTLLHFERSLLLAAQEKQEWNHQPQPKLESELLSDDDEEPAEEPHPGSIISLASIPQLSPSPLTLTFAAATLNHPIQDDRGTPTPTNEPSKLSKTTAFIPNNSPSVYSSPPISPLKQDDSPTLRLIRSLGHGAFSAVWLAEDLSRVPLTLVSKKSVRDLRRRVSGRDKARKREKEKGNGGDGEIEKMRDEHKLMQGDHVELTIDGASPEEGSHSSSPRNMRDGLKTMLSFSSLPKLAPPPPSSCKDYTLSRSPSDMDPLSWNSCDLPSSIWQQDADMDKDLSTLSPTSSIRSFHSYSSFSGGGEGTTGISRHPSLGLPTNRGDSSCLSRDSSLKKFRDRVRGTRPMFRLGRAYLDERHGEMGWKDGAGIVGGEERENEKGEQIYFGANLSRHSSLRGNNVHGTNGRLVAVKMTPRKVRGAKGRRERAEEERTRVGFVREVEVLKHISHPNITPLLAHLSTSSHHILILPYLQGGDLLGLVNNDVAWGKLGESILRRIWCELCKAVGWMHGVGLVHRDIKLENILLTTPAFNSLTPTSPPPTLSSIPTPPTPFIKLTDFGLSRFVEIDANGEAELLWTRCGSEAYAAPELVTGGGGSSGGGGGSREGGERRGVYDARKTDAWACGVVLYALVGRQLPFGEGVGAQPIGGGNSGSRIERERGAGKGGLTERRHWLMRIARGEYEWPGDRGEDVEEERQSHVEQDELVGTGLVHSQGAKRIVGRLLTRDPRKRARIGDLWDDSWMTLCRETGNGSGNAGGGGDDGWWKEREKERDWYDPSMMMVSMEGALSETQGQQGLGHVDGHEDEDSLDVQGRNQHTIWIPDRADLGGITLEDCCEGEDGKGENGKELLLLEEEEEEEGGCLFDHEGIDSITRQEVV